MALSLTSQALRKPSLRLLYHQVVVDLDEAQVLAARFLSSETRPFACHNVVVDGFVEVEQDWSTPDQTRTFKLSPTRVLKLSSTISLVARTLQPKTLQLSMDEAPLSVFDLAAWHNGPNLLIGNAEIVEFSPYVMSTLFFSSLVRLGLYNCIMPWPEAFLNLVSFPNLKTLAAHGNVGSSAWDSADMFGMEATLPLCRQLNGISTALSCPGILEGPAVFDTIVYTGDWTRECAKHLPSSVRVLRLQRGDDAVPSDLPAYLSVVPALTHLEELHLVAFNLSNDSKGQDDVQSWTAERGVRLFVEDPNDLNDSFDPSFWRFLDGVKARLGLDV
ncbi:hypothetical protein JCM6882_008584 [Rhodosporidiobolus microsporus]